MSAPRKVSFARLHEAFQQPGVTGLSNLPKTLCTSQQKGIQMWYTSEGLEVTLNEATFIIPLNNLAGARFDRPKDVPAVKPFGVANLSKSAS